LRHRSRHLQSGEKERRKEKGNVVTCCCKKKEKRKNLSLFSPFTHIVPSVLSYLPFTHIALFFFQSCVHLFLSLILHSSSFFQNCYEMYKYLSEEPAVNRGNGKNNNSGGSGPRDRHYYQQQRQRRQQHERLQLERMKREIQIRAEISDDVDLDIEEEDEDDEDDDEDGAVAAEDGANVNQRRRSQGRDSPNNRQDFIRISSPYLLPDATLSHMVKECRKLFRSFY
jgi:hypothetical protein